MILSILFTTIVIPISVICYTVYRIYKLQLAAKKEADIRRLNHQLLVGEEKQPWPGRRSYTEYSFSDRRR